jgi:hypothetical protein
MSIRGHDKRLMTRKWGAVPLAFAVLTTAVAGYGCATPAGGATSTTPPSTTTISAPPAESIEGIRGSDSLGLTVVLAPMDSNGALVVVEGSLDALLWLESDIGGTKTNQLIQEWQDVPVTRSDYTAEGAIIDLRYSQPLASSPGYGILDVAFRFSGIELTTEVNDVELVGNPG